MPARSLRMAGRAVSGRASFTVTCSGPVTSAWATFCRSALMLLRASVRPRSRLNFTAAASIGVPSWNRMPGLMSSTMVRGSGKLKAAMPGLAFSVS